MKDILGQAFNQTIQALRKTGWTRETLVKVGEILTRTYSVFQAYRNQKQKFTAAEWIEKALSFGKELSDAIPSGLRA